MESRGNLLVVLLIISTMAVDCYGSKPHRSFSDLKNNLFVEATASKTGDLMAGVDKIEVKWGTLKNVSSDTAKGYQKVKVKLCYTPISQQDRPWRKTNLENIAKDKTCQFVMFDRDYKLGANDSDTYSIKRDIPGATYFIRAYAFDADGKEQAYGQTPEGTTFTVVGITGRSTSLDAASGVFSAFSVISLVYFFYMEKRKAKKASASSPAT